MLLSSDTFGAYHNTMTSKEYSAETASASSSQNGTNDTVHIGEKQADGALLFLRHNAEALPTSSSEQELQRVRRKVDYRIIPLLFLIYFLNFIDKILLNVRRHPSDIGRHALTRCAVCKRHGYLQRPSTSG